MKVTWRPIAEGALVGGILAVGVIALFAILLWAVGTGSGWILALAIAIIGAVIGAAFRVFLG